MHKKLRQIVAILMLLVIFITNTGFVVVKHYCKLRGERTFLFKKPTDICCGETKKSEKTTFESPACCIEKFNFYKLSIDLNVAYFAAISLAIPQELFSFDFSPVCSVIFPVQEEIIHYSNPPPLPSGKTLLHHICSYLI